MTKESNAYVLGTEAQERHRLGVQHQVWSTEANRAWQTAGFTDGMTLLDLGCGPGFCTQELAYIAGHSGRVIAVDRSQQYIDFLQQIKDLHSLNIDPICSDFDDMQLPDGILDGVYTRWALAWLSDVEIVLGKVIRAMKPGACLAIHEYYDWSLLQTEPYMPHLYPATRVARESLSDLGGDIDIGRRLPSILLRMGMEIVSTRPMTKQARAHENDWNWPKSFLEIYLPKLIDTGRLTENEVKLAIEELRTLQHIEGATLQMPLMIEVIARKK